MEHAGAMPTSIDALRSIAAEIGAAVIARECDEVDVQGRWPERGLKALAQAGLMGLHMPRHVGGHAQGLLALAVVSEELGRHCSSTAMCFGMHCVAARALASKASADHEERFLRPIAEGRHITSLALSEPGTGANFFLPRTQFRQDGDHYFLRGEKSFVTSGAHADSYVISAVPPGEELDPGTFSCFAIEANAPGLEWKEDWRGFGMRGNSSRSVLLNDVRIPAGNLLGEKGDEIWYVFDVVAPHFIVAMAGVYIGIARAALETSIENLKGRRHHHTGETLSAVPALAQQVAEMWIELERTRQLVHHAARQGDAGDQGAALSFFAAKADVAAMVASVTQTAMAVSGGRAYRENSKLSRLLRDAQAAHVMAPTTQMLKAWLGRSLLDLPLL